MPMSPKSITPAILRSRRIDQHVAGSEVRMCDGVPKCGRLHTRDCLIPKYALGFPREFGLSEKPGCGRPQLPPEIATAEWGCLEMRVFERNSVEDGQESAERRCKRCPLTRAETPENRLGKLDTIDLFVADVVRARIPYFRDRER